MILKALIVGILLCFGEAINGNIRVRILHHLYGKKRAKTISFFTGMAIIVLIAWLTLPWINPNSFLDCYIVGLIWVLMLVILDLYFARQVFKFKWPKIAEDFNPMKGNLLSIGIVLLFFVPGIVYWAQMS